MPTEYPACREADNGGSNLGVEAPWIEPASRSVSEPETASLHQERVANLSDVPKPEIRREAIFTSAAGLSGVGGGSAQGRLGWADWETHVAGCATSATRCTSNP